jgi:hypothetical protein
MCTSWSLGLAVAAASGSGGLARTRAARGAPRAQRAARPSPEPARGADVVYSLSAAPPVYPRGCMGRENADRLSANNAGRGATARTGVVKLSARPSETVLARADRLVARAWRAAEEHGVLGDTRVVQAPLVCGRGIEQAADIRDVPRSGRAGVSYARS